MEYELKSRSASRGRLLAGGTYFRSRLTGQQANAISIEAFEYGPGKARVIITNHNTVNEENISGPVDINLLEQHLEWNEGYSIINLTTTPTARLYSISSQIAGDVITYQDIGAFSFSRIFNVPSKVSAKLSLKSSEVTPSSEIRIGSRYKVYELAQISKPGGTPEAPTTETGWDIEGLRAAMVNDPWVQMPERGSDPQDTGQDETLLTMFERKYLSGGDGLPLTPAGIHTGPSSSLIHLNYTEAESGALIETNQVFVWNEGWVPY